MDEPIKIKSDYAAERLALAIVRGQVDDMKSTLRSLASVRGDGFKISLDKAEYYESALRESKLLGLVGLDADYVINKLYMVICGMTKKELIMVNTKFENLTKYVIAHGWKSLASFYNECGIKQGGATNAFKTKGRINDDMLNKMANGLDIDTDTLQDILAGVYIEANDFAPKPVTFEAVAEALPEAPALAKAEPEPVEAPAQEPRKPDFIVEDYDNAPDDSALEAEICKTINKDLKSDSFTPTVECDPTIVYISNLQAEADKQNNYDDNMFRWLQANKPEVFTEYEAWLKQTKNKQVIGTIEADMKDLWDVYNSDALYETRMKALAEMLIAMEARLKLYKEELTDGN